MEQRPRAVHLEPHQPGELGAEPPGPQVCVAVAETAPVLRGQVDATDGEVAGHVLPEVRELEPSTHLVREPRTLGVERLAQV